MLHFSYKVYVFISVLVSKNLFMPSDAFEKRKGVKSELKNLCIKLSHQVIKISTTHYQKVFDQNFLRFIERNIRINVTHLNYIHYLSVYLV